MSRREYAPGFSRSPEFSKSVPRGFVYGLAMSSTGRETDKGRKGKDDAPSTASAYANRGGALQAQGKLDEALESFDRAISLEPDYAEAFSARGTILFALGRADEALASFDKAILLEPRNANGYYNRGFALQTLARFPEALESYDKAILVDRSASDAHFNRGNVLFALERYHEALASYDEAIALKPDFAEGHNGRGKALQALNRPEDALKSYERAIALKPRYAEAFNNHGVALHALGRLKDALLSCERALGFNPSDAVAWNNRGLVLKDLKRPREAIANFDRAIALAPDFAEAFFNRALAELSLGAFGPGWADYEHRRGVKIYAPARAAVDAPEWTGENLSGRSILVCSEQGNGDIIQFCRYLITLRELGADVSFLIPERLAAILANLSGRIRLSSSPSPSDRFDFQCALMSLPHRLKLSAISAAPAYLRAEPQLVEAWRARIGRSGLKVGISWQGGVWQGGPAVTARSFHVRELYPLSRLDGVRLISLQKNLGTEQLAEVSPDMRVEALGEDFDAGPNAFTDAAAVMESLDLVVSCDTSIAHLAGALGRPVWVALKFAPDWRWGLEGKETRWYPSMRLFRQKAPEDWGPVFREIAAEMRTLRL
jgi:tetratricopeptide (TPR) repeat protein